MTRTLVADNATNPKRVRLLNHDETAGERWTGYLGRNSRGDRVWVNVEFTTVTVNLRSRRETVEHRQLDTGETYTEVSVTGDLVEKDRCTVSSCGQLHEQFADIAEPAPGLTRAEVARFAELADRWHLNGMRAGCAGQTVVWEDSTYGRRPSLTLTQPCPATEDHAEYRYGHAWLIEELPAHVEAELRAFVAKLDGDER